MARPIGSNGVKIDTIINTLRQYPNGATTKQLAKHLGVKMKTLQSRLSKTATYGRGIDRELHRKGTLGHEAIWRVK